MEIMYFEYDEQQIEYLKQKEPLLAQAIEIIGDIRREIIPDLYQAIINSIIGQQISTKAQESIWQRFIERFSPIEPEHINKIEDDVLQQCGISFRKVTYIKEVTKSILTKEIDLSLLDSMNNEQVIEYLSQIKGIGKWTAQMLMMFSMQRLDILSYDDLAIQRGLRMLYHHRKITVKLFNKYKRRYSPYASIASLYLWEIASFKYEEFKDYAPKK